MVGRSLQFQLNSVGDAVQASRHAALENLHQLAPQRSRPDQDSLVLLGTRSTTQQPTSSRSSLPSGDLEEPGILPSKEGLLLLQDRTRQVRPLAASGRPLVRPADDAYVAEVQRVPVALQDLSALLGGHKVHLGDDSDRSKTKRVDFSARSQGRRVGEIDVGSTDGKDDVGLLNVLCAQV